MFDYEAYYNNVSSIFNDVRLDKEAEILMTTSIIKQYNCKFYQKVLDIGCGTGRYAVALKNEGYDVIGIDKSASQVEQAKKHIDAIVGNANNLPFCNASFDLCLLIMVIQQMSEDDRELAFTEIKRALKKGGIVVIKTCSTEDLKKRFSNKYFPSAFKLNKKRYPTINEIETMLINHGFYIISKVNTEINDVMDSNQWIYSVEHKHNSTLALLSNTEFKRGLQSIKADYPNNIRMTKTHRHTYIIAKSSE